MEQSALDVPVGEETRPRELRLRREIGRERGTMWANSDNLCRCLFVPSRLAPAPSSSCPPSTVKPALPTAFPSPSDTDTRLVSLA